MLANEAFTILGKAIPYVTGGFLGYEIGTGKAKDAVQATEKTFLPTVNNIFFYVLVIFILYMIFKGKL